MWATTFDMHVLIGLDPAEKSSSTTCLSRNLNLPYPFRLLVLFYPCPQSLLPGRDTPACIDQESREGKSVVHFDILCFVGENMIPELAVLVGAQRPQGFPGRRELNILMNLYFPSKVYL